MENSHKIAFVTGITGQDGSFLAEFLLSRGYAVHGLVRRNSSTHLARIEHLREKITLHWGDLTDGLTLAQIIERIKPDEIYNLGAQSHVHVSFENPVYTLDATGTGAVRLLEAVRQKAKDARVYQAGSSEMFGISPPPLNEQTRFHPRSIYACAKVCAHHAAVQYREAFGMFVCNGILFNHESERRGENFVTRKITKAVAAIKKQRQDKLLLGNLTARRDWGYAKEYVEVMWLMLQQNQPDDFVIGTGASHSVNEFVDAAFAHADLDPARYVEMNAEFNRPSDIPHLTADITKAKRVLGWEPKVSFEQLVRLMVEHDLRQP